MAELAPEPLDRKVLALGFDALRKHPKTKIASQLDHGPKEGLALGVVKVSDKGASDLHDVDGKSP